MPQTSAQTCFEREALPQMRRVYARAYRLTRNVADAEDLVQETYLRAFRAFERYTPGTNVVAWLLTILHRSRTDHLRKKRRSPRTVELIAEPAAAPIPPAEGEDPALLRSLRRLPELFRTPVVLRDVQDFTYQEIANRLRVPVGTVMSRIHRGRARLRRMLGGGVRGGDARCAIRRSRMAGRDVAASPGLPA